MQTRLLIASVTLCTLLSACASTQGTLLKSSNGVSFGKTSGELESVTRFALPDVDSIFSGDGQFYALTTAGMQKRPVLANVVTGKKLKGRDADALMKQLDSLDLSKEPFMPLDAGWCEKPQFSCGYLREERKIVALNKQGQELELMYLPEASVAKNERELLGEKRYLEIRHADLIAAVSAGEADSENLIVADLGNRLDTERMWRETNLPRFQEQYLKALRAPGNLAGFESAYSVSGDISEVFSAEKSLALVGSNADKAKFNKLVDKALVDASNSGSRSDMDKLLSRYAESIDFEAVLKRGNDEYIKKYALNRYRSQQTQEGWLDAFEISKDLDDLFSAKEKCRGLECTVLEQRVVDYAISENANVLELKVGKVDTASGSTTSKDLGIIMSADLSRGKVRAPVTVSLSDTFRQLGFMQPDSVYRVSVEAKLNYKLTFRAVTRLGRMSDEPMSYSDQVQFVLNAGNNYSKTLPAEYQAVLSTVSSNILRGETTGRVLPGSMKIRTRITSVKVDG